MFLSGVSPTLEPCLNLPTCKCIYQHWLAGSHIILVCARKPVVLNKTLISTHLFIDLEKLEQCHGWVRISPRIWYNVGRWVGHWNRRSEWSSSTRMETQWKTRENILRAVVLQFKDVYIPSLLKIGPLLVWREKKLLLNGQNHVTNKRLGCAWAMVAFKGLKSRDQFV